ncbi:sterol desaturase family protein [Halobacteriovorax sp.]|uniref:sterol desaturase family protein n=1 Tax=Halobacteriovorax sp. TaxID=2020862 RepID=UPI003AF28B2D
MIADKVNSIGIGLFNWLNLPENLEIILSLIFFDFFIYLQHIATHKFKFLWKFHQVHHADIDLDVSSGNRFHTIEIALSFLYKFLLILLIGPSSKAVILFEILLNSMAMFNHSNIFIPKKIDNILRCFIVTPDMHRIHHSIKKNEHNSNFGFNLSIWDFIFKTYKESPSLGQLKMTIGLPYFRQQKYISPISLLTMPFQTKDEE